MSQIIFFTASLATLALASVEISVTRHPHPDREGRSILKVSGMEPSRIFLRGGTEVDFNGTYTEFSRWYTKNKRVCLRIRKWEHSADNARNIRWVLENKHCIHYYGTCLPGADPTTPNTVWRKIDKQLTTKLNPQHSRSGPFPCHKCEAGRLWKAAAEVGTTPSRDKLRELSCDGDSLCKIGLRGVLPTFKILPKDVMEATGIHLLPCLSCKRIIGHRQTREHFVKPVLDALPKFPAPIVEILLDFAACSDCGNGGKHAYWLS